MVRCATRRRGERSLTSVRRSRFRHRRRRCPVGGAPPADGATATRMAIDGRVLAHRDGRWHMEGEHTPTTGTGSGSEAGEAAGPAELPEEPSEAAAVAETERFELIPGEVVAVYEGGATKVSAPAAGAGTAACHRPALTMDLCALCCGRRSCRCSVCIVQGLVRRPDRRPTCRRRPGTRQPPKRGRRQPWTLAWPKASVRERNVARDGRERRR